MTSFLSAWAFGTILAFNTTNSDRAGEPFKVPSISVNVANQKIDLLVSMTAPAAAVINESASFEFPSNERTGSRPTAKVAGIKLKGQSVALKAEIGEQQTKKIRIMRFPGDYTNVHDGAIGVGALPDDKVIVFGDGQFDSAHQITFPLTKKRSTFQHVLSLGKHEIEIRFSFEDAQSKANFAAGQVLVREGLATRSNSLVNGDVAFGVERPMEPLKMQQKILGRSLPVILSRVSTRRADELGKVVAEIDDPDEVDTIVVYGRRKSKRQIKPYIKLGRDWLVGCTDAVVDKKTKELAIYCD